MAGRQLLITLIYRLQMESSLTIITGSFSYNAYGELTGGTITQYNIYKSGVKQYQITGLSHDIMILGSFATFTEASQYIFNGNDTFHGSAYSDVLYSYAGNDVLNGNGGNDALDGGTGNDILNGGVGNDFIEGQLGVDYLYGGAGNDYLDGGSSLSWLTGDGNNFLYGGSGDDELWGVGGNDTLSGDDGNDYLDGYNGNDILNGGTGIDTMYGGAGNDTYFVDKASDTTMEESSADGYDTVLSTVSRGLGNYLEKLVLTGTAAINGYGNALDNSITGNTANNSLYGYAGNDTLNGGAGNDLLDGGNGNDALIGGTGIDTMSGGFGNDTYFVDSPAELTTETSAAGGYDTVVSTASRGLGNYLEKLVLSGTASISGYGNALDNSITGNTAANSLYGYAGNDFLNGGAGNDTISSGFGNDTMIGGGGMDTFAFDSILNASANMDTIADFSVVDDTIRLDRTFFAKLTTLGTLNTAFFNSSTTGQALDSNDYILYNTTTGALLYDADANGTGVATQFATLTTKPAITAADFMVVA